MFNINIKSTELELDTDDLESLVSIIGEDNITITDHSDYDIPDFIMTCDIEDIIEYITNCDEDGYEVYCNHHEMFMSLSEYESARVGTFSGKNEILDDYLEQYGLPQSILNCIDYDKLLDDLEYTVIYDAGVYYAFVK